MAPTEHIKALNLAACFFFAIGAWTGFAVGSYVYAMQQIRTLACHPSACSSHRATAQPTTVRRVTII